MNELEQEDTQLMEREITPLVRRAQEFEVKTDEDSILAQGEIQKIIKTRKAVEEKFGEPRDKAHKAWKAACDLFNFFVKPLTDAETIYRRKVSNHENDKERKRLEEQKRAEAEAREKQRIENEKLEAKAKKAEEKGQVEKAQALRETAATTPSMPIFTPPVVAKAEGSSFKTVWRARIVDSVAVCRLIGHKQLPTSIIEFKTAKLNDLADLYKDSQKFDGIEFYSEKTLITRTKG